MWRTGSRALVGHQASACVLYVCLSVSVSVSRWQVPAFQDDSQYPRRSPSLPKPAALLFSSQRAASRLSAVACIGHSACGKLRFGTCGFKVHGLWLPDAPCPHHPAHTPLWFVVRCLVGLMRECGAWVAVAVGPECWWWPVLFVGRREAPSGRVPVHWVQCKCMEAISSTIRCLSGAACGVCCGGVAWRGVLCDCGRPTPGVFPVYPLPPGSMQAEVVVPVACAAGRVQAVSVPGAHVASSSGLASVH
jgi:hypothetical protein